MLREEPYLLDSYKQNQQIEEEKQKMEDSRLEPGSMVRQQPPGKSFMLKVEAAMQNLQDIANPTLQAQNHPETIKEIQDRLYDKMVYKFDQYNECMKNMFDEHDRNRCEGNLLNFLNIDLPQEAKTILRDY